MSRYHRNKSLQQTIGMTGSQIPTSPTPETMNRLEVESASSTSLPNSVPYYNISDHHSSLDTVSLLRGQPQYTNTSHLNLGTSTGNRSSGIAGAPVKVDTPRNDDTFNQVPKRFSQFILDQQNPYVAQRLDNLSLNSLSVSEQSRERRLKRRTFSRASRQNKTGTATQSLTSGFGHSAVARSSTNISESMGSQATIFSTRDQLINRRATRRRQRPHSHAAASEGSTLSRQNAVRIKQGGWFYRLRIRLARLAKKLKYRFFASSKRTGSVKRHGKRKVSISHPNRRLGVAPETVPFLDENLKSMAGAYPVHLRSRSPQKRMEENQKMKNAKNQEMQNLQNLQNLNQNSQLPVSASQPPASGSRRSSASSSTPPPVPPHFVRRSMTAPLFDDTNDTIELWRQYLAHVVCRRVLLRQEINQFQNYLAGQDPLLHRLSAIRTQMPRASYQAVVKNVGDSSSEYETVSDFSGSSISEGSEFSQNVLHRRSMLGEMLDYDSDGVSVTSQNSESDYSHQTNQSNSQSFSSKNSNSTESSELSAMKRYGTVRRHKLQKSVTPSLGSLRRSPGVQMDLNGHSRE
ncbi:hypothetical protein PGUG_04144 [Meyerozyma guilliermondii ATCC 6260]|uniref:Uncharacterized protein n=1 Tax=Meyerozyma guilliermondii (strain ATCC 6260 / CBS 566 / DSM 6381 / JCM 1539 / NBRC 10279 / NRRL Y-324) TaxID=294746 RepID=A5DLJ3_PICGU|nr:uncharacterized protein PGUG_04144 [Meyerozyma guilliermondii ATCC 6260]EDK40046.2 hypothetical protein PGUG_04144 [Meyerozyma guilliermondii ATCC 6260]